MARLVWFVCIVRAAVSLAKGTGGKLVPARLIVESDDVQTRIENHSVVPDIAENRSLVLKGADGQKHPEATAIGSLTCMRWTGGSCKYFACKADRGAYATCEDGYCMCKPDTCADAEGKCIPHSEGKWIGEYSIRFGKPFLPDRPFLGVDKDAAGWSGPAGAIAFLATVSTSDKQWKIAQTPSGRVRLTNTKHPGSVLVIYNSRRRSDFMQREAQRQQKKMTDDDDLWPMLMKLEAATPLAATFQVRPTLRNGGGYELWDPENQVSLASADPDSWGDSAVKQGVTECYHKSSWTSDPCEEGKQLIAFDPKLPVKVVVEVHRSHIVAISVLTWWQTALIICCVCGCVGCCMHNEDDPNSRPLFVHVFGSAAAAAESRAAAAREAEAERERERKAFAEKIAGFWLLESDMGNFEYELQTTSEGISVHGRAQGAEEWDSMFAGQLIPAVRSTDVDQLRWEDNSGTKFSLTFEDDKCSGMARAAGGQEVSFSGKRTEPSA